MYDYSRFYDPGKERRDKELEDKARELKRNRIESDPFLLALEKTVRDAKQVNNTQDAIILLEKLLNNYIDLKPESK